MSGRVLVADGDVARGRAVAAACRARGFECRTASHGAATLEAALAAPPDVVVCQLALPLIDGPRLAAILKANPRTRDLVLVFLADRRGEGEGRELPGRLIPAPGEPELVARCVEALREGRAAGEPAEDGGGVEGQLAELPLSDLLQLFHVSRKTGTIEVVRGLGRTRRQMGRITLSGGDLVDARIGPARGEKALFRLLSWDRGSFAFRPGAAEEDEATIQSPTQALLREGVRQLREWKRLAEELPPASATVSLQIARSSLPNVIHPLTQEVLVVLDLYSKVQDVVDHCSYPDYQVLRTLQTLIRRGMLELKPEPPAPPLAREMQLVGSAGAARLREWVGADRPGALARDAKLLVVSSRADAAGEFARLLGRLSGVELAPALERQGVGRDDLMSLGRVAVDGELGIELVHVPAAEAMAPLWSLAAHGALGTLLLLAGPVAEAVKSLEAASRALAAPGSRAFHVRLLEKGERASPEELRDHVALVDRGSLYLMPLENPENAGLVLRELFARLLG